MNNKIKTILVALVFLISSATSFAPVLAEGHGRGDDNERAGRTQTQNNSVLNPGNSSKPRVTISGGDENGSENEDNGEDGRGTSVCPSVMPPGHSIAPGWLRHHDDEIGNPEDCGNQTTSTPPIASAPAITNLATTSMLATSTKVTWTTDQPATSEVWLGTAAPMDTSLAPNASANGLVTSHDLFVSNLSPSSTYFYVVGSANASGTLATSSVQSFTTPSTIPPPLAILSVDATSTTATGTVISWTTNKPASGELFYGTTTPITAGNSIMIGTSTLDVSHQIQLTGLNASTTYYFFIAAFDASQNQTTSTELNFTTIAIAP